MSFLKMSLNNFCWKQTIDRGVGTIPNYCNKKEYVDGLCYNYCKKDYKGVGAVCWENCKRGYHDDGAFCRKSIPLHIYAKKTYGRGIGTIPKCSPDLIYDGGLCYNSCNKTYEGVGPLCWKTCSDKLPISCGAGCAISRTICMNTILNQITSIPKVMTKITYPTELFQEIEEQFKIPIC